MFGFVPELDAVRVRDCESIGDYPIIHHEDHEGHEEHN